MDAVHTGRHEARWLMMKVEQAEVVRRMTNRVFMALLLWCGSSILFLIYKTVTCERFFQLFACRYRVSAKRGKIKNART
jgi:hypothetical protein